MPEKKKKTMNKAKTRNQESSAKWNGIIEVNVGGVEIVSQIVEFVGSEEESVKSSECRLSGRKK